MESTQFSHAIEVRYGDLDPQGHVNNANFLTYLEQTRIHYLVELGLFKKGESFLEVGITNGAGFATVKTQLVGDYNLPNVLCAIAVGKHFKCYKYNFNFSTIKRKC